MKIKQDIPLIRSLQKYGKLDENAVFEKFFGRSPEDDQEISITTSEYLFFMKMVRLIHTNTDTQIKKRVHEKMKVHIRLTRLPEYTKRKYYQSSGSGSSGL